MQQELLLKITTGRCAASSVTRSIDQSDEYDLLEGDEVENVASLNLSAFCTYWCFEKLCLLDACLLPWLEKVDLYRHGNVHG
jgi:hypothetical protein